MKYSACLLLQPNFALLCSFVGTGVRLNELEILNTDEMLLSNIIDKAQGLLQHQFPDIMGLSTPIYDETHLARVPPATEEHRTYAPSCENLSYIQIINTGYNHWITAFKQKGEFHMYGTEDYTISIYLLSLP